MYDKLDMKNAKKVEIQEKSDTESETEESDIENSKNESMTILAKNEIKGKTWNRKNSKITRNKIEKVAFLYVFINLGSFLGLGYSVITLTHPI